MFFSQKSRGFLQRSIEDQSEKLSDSQCKVLTNLKDLKDGLKDVQVTYFTELPIVQQTKNHTHCTQCKLTYILVDIIRKGDSKRKKKVE